MLNDEAILALFFKRSEQGIQELDSKYGKLCHKLSYNILNNWSDAEECVNDGYLGAWNAIPPARPNPLSAYLCRIVRNISLNRYYKNEARKRNSIYDVAMEEINYQLSSPDTVETEIETKELTLLIEQFLDTLTLENRIIFMRRYWFIDTYQDIATHVGITEKNVSVRLVRIRKKLKQYLLEREVFV